uniref:PARP catalytic domain-containing protein n=1 Tax=Zooxanthella nutricula TaxID=1333877 RepID=A0A7S2PQA0_9DINO
MFGAGPPSAALMAGPQAPQGPPGQAVCGRSAVLMVAWFVLLAGALSVAVWARFLRPPPVPVPPAILQLALQAGGGNGQHRGNNSSPMRATVEGIFRGTHVQGFKSVASELEFRSMVHSGVSATGQFGPVELSPSAQSLRAAFEQLGFARGTFYHGTKNINIPSILGLGFLVSDGWHGKGVYTAKTYAHAQCYAGGGEPVVKVDVYWRDQAKDRYIRHVNHDSIINDVYLVKDPLLMFPIEVIRCCHGDLPCL